MNGVLRRARLARSGSVRLDGRSSAGESLELAAGRVDFGQPGPAGDIDLEATRAFDLRHEMDVRQ
jgi:hypothetical protein